LLQQLLTESVLLASLGAILAVPLHLLAARALPALFPSLEYASTLRPNAGARVLLFGTLLTLGTALVFGLGPALQAASRDIASVLRETSGRGKRRWVRFREGLVVGQALVSALVLAAGGLFTRSLQNARRMDPGFALDHAITFTLDPELSPAYDARRTKELYRRLHDRIAALPGVQSMGRAVSIPLDGTNIDRRLFPDGEGAEISTAPVAELNVITSGFLATLGTRMLDGREFVPLDTAATVEPVIVNTVLARRLWPSESAIGKRLRLQSANGELLEVVGVAQASMYRTLGERPRSAIWLSLDRNPRSRTTVLVRTAGTPSGLTASIERAVRDLDAELPIVGLGTLRDHVSVAYVSIESGAIGALAFGGIGLLLAASGLYGLTAFAASQRRREIGIRRALGARSGSVMKLVAGRALGLTAIGALAGGLVVAFVPMGLDSMLHGVKRYDILTLIVATGAFCAVAVVAALAATRRAIRQDPMSVLRLD
jgi:predicted permease